MIRVRRSTIERELGSPLSPAERAIAAELEACASDSPRILVDPNASGSSIELPLAAALEREEGAHG
jgi:hypothetical protein